MADEDSHEVWLAADRKLWSMVEEDRFTGQRWHRLIDFLVEAGVTRMRRDLRTKDIFKHCVKRGWSLHAPDGWVSADQDSMVQETVASALEAFLRRCRAGEGWDPDRGSTLNDYFLGLCRGEFANVFRRWLTSRTRGEAELPTDGGPNALHADEDTARAALARTLLQKIKDTGVLSELQRRLLFGHAYGLTHYELARQYDISSRAVEGHIHRARRQLRKEGITW